ncbi:hypothetical protein MG293_001774 [Ovis ammon polii]|uniref:Uncharacterized protein n=1 Tax=Ovis ammon polii TaxID=230172 RepID=A0AAD4YIC3_OVIAM|nr:hypothetical protein MG293_001774 [Ovis ammon polii]
MDRGICLENSLVEDLERIFTEVSESSTLGYEDKIWYNGFIGNVSAKDNRAMPSAFSPKYTFQTRVRTKAFAYNAEDRGSIPGSGRSPGEGNGNPLQYSCLENPMEGEACLSSVRRNPTKNLNRTSGDLGLCGTQFENQGHNFTDRKH